MRTTAPDDDQPSESPELTAKKKRKTPFSATKAAIKEAKRRGWHAGIVERHISFGGRFAKDGRKQTKIDLFGCVDIVMLDQLTGVLGVQATSSSSNAAERRAKIDDMIREHQTGAVVQWIWAGNRLEVWHFPEHKLKRGGVRKVRDFVRHRLVLERVGPLRKNQTWDELPIQGAWVKIEGTETP